MIDNGKIQKFMSEKIKFERNCFITNTGLKIPGELGLPNNDEEFEYINERGNITRDGCEYLLDKFNSEGERENLSWDIGYFKGYVSGLNDFLKFLNTTK